MNRDYLKYLSSLLLFGSNGILASQIALHSSYIVMFRTMLGSLLLILLFFLTGHRLSIKSHPRDFLLIAVSGISMGASWIFLYEAYVQIGVGIASLFYYCGPIIVMMLSPIFFQERLTTKKLVSFATVLTGIVLINAQASEPLNGVGIVCGIGSAVLYASMLITNKKATHIGGMENSCIQLFFGFLTAAVYVAFNSGLYVTVPANSLPWLLMLGFLNTGVGCYLYFSAINKLPVQSVAICGYLEPASAIVYSVIFLHEMFSLWQLVGILLILGGAMYGELQPKRKPIAAKA